MRRGLVSFAVALTVLGCAADPYPLPSDPPNAGQLNPAAVGETTRAVLIYVTVRPGDRLELVGADAIGTLDGAEVQFLLSRPTIDANGVSVTGENFEDLAGTVVTGATGSDTTVGIAAALTPQRPGRYEVTNVRLRYRLNGGREQAGDGIDIVWTVCADNPAPSDCPEEPGS
jgi:hypothetical protein